MAEKFDITGFENADDVIKLLKNLSSLGKSLQNELVPAMDQSTASGAVMNESIQKSSEILPKLNEGATSSTANVNQFSQGMANLSTISDGLSSVISIIPSQFAGIGSAALDLISVVANLVSGLTATSQEVNELSASSRGAVEAMTQNQQSLEDNNTSITSSVLLAQEYVDELRRMETAGLDTAESQQKYRDIVTQLNTLMPQLNVQIDEQTGYVRGGSDALKEQVNIMGQTARFADIDQARTEQIILLTQAQKEQSDNETKLQENIAEGNRLAKEEAELSKQLTEAGTDYSAVQQDLNDRMREVREEIAANEEENRNLNESLEINKENIGELAEGLEVLDSQYLTLGVDLSEADIGEASKEQLESLGASLIQTQEQIDALNAKYQESYDKAYASIDSQINLFGDLSGKSKISMDEVLGSLQSQIDFMDTYADNIDQAMALGVDKGLIEKLSDGSEESARILQAIVDDGGANVEELNKKFSGVNKGKEDFAATVANMETDFKKSMEGLESTLSDTITELNQAEEAAKSGDETVQGYINAAKRRYTDIYNAYKELGTKSLMGYNEALGINSPSKEAMKAGGFVVDGLILGAKLKKQDLLREYEELAQASADALNSESLQNRILLAEPADYTNCEVDYSGLLYKILDQLSKNGTSVQANFYDRALTPYEEAKRVEELRRKLIYGN